MDNIKNILQDVVGKIAAKEPDSISKLERIWGNLLTPLERAHTRLEGVRGGTVLVRVDSPLWLYQMRVRKKILLDRLKSEQEFVKDLRFKIGNIQSEEPNKDTYDSKE